jgi:hypothetical protein
MPKFKQKGSDIEQAQEKRVIKSANLPERCLIRCLVYDIDFPKKAREASGMVGNKLTMLDGLDVKTVALSYFDETKEHKLIDWTEDNGKYNVTFPLGKTGFRNTLWFRNSDGWCKFKKLVPASDGIEAEQNFRIYINKTLGVPLSIDGNLIENAGFAINCYRTWYFKPTKQLDGSMKDQYNSDLSIWVKPTLPETKGRVLNQDEVKFEIMKPELVAAIYQALETDETLSFP